MASLPPAERQAEFITKLQHLLAEGEFVRTGSLRGLTPGCGVVIAS